MAIKSESWPKSFKRGGIVVKVYQRLDKDALEYMVTWYVGKTRRFKKFSNEDKAVCFAKDQVDLLCASKLGVAGMMDSDRETFLAISDLVEPLGVGLLAAMTDYVAAAKVMGAHGSLVTAAKEFVERATQVKITTPTQEVVEEFIAILEAELEIKPKRLRDVQTMRSHLRQFAKFAQKPIQEVTLDNALTWLRRSTVTDRSHNNKRTSLVRLGNFCKQKSYLPNDRPTPFDLIRRKRNVSEHEVFALPPQSLRTLLDAAMAAENHEAALYYAFGFFTGMRTSELQRFLWEHVDLDRNLIVLPAWVTKNNRKRKIPIQPVLAAWLKILPTQKRGKVLASEKVTDRSIDFARPLMPIKPSTHKKESEGDWWENCMRDSYASYRAMIIYSVGQVALEIGNSEPMVRRSYFDVTADEHDAKLWFETGPKGWDPAMTEK